MSQNPIEAYVVEPVTEFVVGSKNLLQKATFPTFEGAFLSARRAGPS